MFYAFIIQEFMHSAQRITFSAIEKKFAIFRTLSKKFAFASLRTRKKFFAFASLRPWAAKKIRPGFAFALGFWANLEPWFKKENLNKVVFYFFFHAEGKMFLFRDRGLKNLPGELDKSKPLSELLRRSWLLLFLRSQSALFAGLPTCHSQELRRCSRPAWLRWQRRRPKNN